MTESSTRAEMENASADSFAQKLFTNVVKCMETYSLYLGDRVGWFTELAAGPLTPAELAERTGTVERYAVEWLEMQAVFGNLAVVDDGNGVRGARRFALPAGVAEVMTDVHSLSYLGAFPELIAAIGAQLDNLVNAYRNGGGVSWGQFGDGMRHAQAALNRPLFSKRLGPVLANLQPVHEVLSGQNARIADVGCGYGWSTIALGKAYPAATVIGFDVDPPSIQMARGNAVAARVMDRVSFELAGAETLADHGEFDAVFAFECLHDMPRPVEVLTAIRQSVRKDGLVLIVDEAVADTFSAPGDEVERTMYGYSTLICLPDGLSSTPSIGTGTVMRRSILTDYATQAGFTEVEVLPIEDFGFFRFYSLH